MATVELLQGDRLGLGGVVLLLAGLNEIPDATWEELLRSRRTRAYLDAGVIREADIAGADGQPHRKRKGKRNK